MTVEGQRTENVKPPAAAVVMGASAGAVEALSAVLPALPAAYPLPVILVVHAPPQRENALVEIFKSKCRMRVKEAEDKEAIAATTIYFAPADYHLLVEPDCSFSLSSEEPVCFCRPAIDVLFETAAAAYGSHLVGIVLTGANEDGAAGLRAVCAAGGLGMVQSPGEALVPTMPEAALSICKDARVLTLREIAARLLALSPAVEKGQSNG